MGREIGIDMAQGGARNAGKPVEGCWFCLSNPNCSSWLLVSIGQASAAPPSVVRVEWKRLLLTTLLHGEALGAVERWCADGTRARQGMGMVATCDH